MIFPGMSKITLCMIQGIIMFLCIMPPGSSEIQGPASYHYGLVGCCARISERRAIRVKPHASRSMRLRGGCQDSAVAGQEDTAASTDTLAAQREARKKAKQQEKEVKKNAKMAAALAVPIQDLDLGHTAVHFQGSKWPEELHGDLEIPRADTGRRFYTLDEVGEGKDGGEGSRVWVRGRVHQVRAKGNSVFLVLRKGLSTIQVRASCSCLCAIGLKIVYAETAFIF
jgi:hypothetical protein